MEELILASSILASVVLPKVCFFPYYRTFFPMILQLTCPQTCDPLSTAATGFKNQTFCMIQTNFCQMLTVERGHGVAKNNVFPPAILQSDC